MVTRLIFPLSLRARINVHLYKFFPKINDKNILLEFNPKVKLDLVNTDYGHKSIIFNGFYELQLTREIAMLAKKGGLLIDVGANFGYFSCLWAAQNTNNEVIAFEASPENIAPLTNNVKKNGLGDQIKIQPNAVGRSKGTLKFSTGGHKDQTSWGGFTIDDNGNDITVNVVSLDDYTVENNIDEIQVLKIDTEGADTWVLYGAVNLLKQKRIHHIFFEHNLHRMSLLNINPDESHTFLEGLGYTIQKFSANEFYAYPTQTPN